MKTKKGKKKIKSKDKLEKSLRTKMADFVKSLGHDAKDIASDLKGISKLLAVKLISSVKKKDKKDKKDNKKEIKIQKKPDHKASVSGDQQVKIIESVKDKHVKPVKSEIDKAKQIATEKKAGASTPQNKVKLPSGNKEVQGKETAITSVQSVNQTADTTLPEIDKKASVVKKSTATGKKVATIRANKSSAETTVKKTATAKSSTKETKPATAPKSTPAKRATSAARTSTKPGTSQSPKKEDTKNEVKQDNPKETKNDSKSEIKDI